MPAPGARRSSRADPLSRSSPRKRGYSFRQSISAFCVALDSRLRGNERRQDERLFTPKSAFRLAKKCSRPAPMNRTGLLVALSLTALAVLIFALFPGLDLALTQLFYDPATATFPVSTSRTAEFLRNAAMWIAWAFAAPSIIAFVVKTIWPNKPLLVKGRTVALMLITMIMTTGILSNATFKGNWGRPRPSDVTEFRGPWQFKN